MPKKESYVTLIPESERFWREGSEVEKNQRKEWKGGEAGKGKDLLGRKRQVRDDEGAKKESGGKGNQGTEEPGLNPD